MGKVQALEKMARVEEADVRAAERMLDDVQRGRVIGLLALVSYTDGSVEQVRIGRTPSALDFS